MFTFCKQNRTTLKVVIYEAYQGVFDNELLNGVPNELLNGLDNETSAIKTKEGV